LLDKLPGVRAHGIQESALPLGEQKVEGEGALATAAHTGDDHELSPGDVDVQVLEVVFAGTADGNRIRGDFLFELVQHGAEDGECRRRSQSPTRKEGENGGRGNPDVSP